MVKALGSYAVMKFHFPHILTTETFSGLFSHKFMSSPGMTAQGAQFGQIYWKKTRSSYLKLLARWKKACPIGFDGSTFLAKIKFNSKLIEPTKKQGQKNRVMTDTKNVVHGAKDGKIPQEAERPSSSAPSHTPSLSCSRTQHSRSVLLMCHTHSVAAKGQLRLRSSVPFFKFPHDSRPRWTLALLNFD